MLPIYLILLSTGLFLKGLQINDNKNPKITAIKGALFLASILLDAASVITAIIEFL